MRQKAQVQGTGHRRDFATWLLCYFAISPFHHFTICIMDVEKLKEKILESFRRLSRRRTSNFQPS